MHILSSLYTPGLPHLPRSYDKAFGRKIFELWEAEKASEQPRQCMRQKVPLNLGATDRELFRLMDLGDTWPDAEMVQLWSYLYGNKRLLIPSGWQRTMAELNDQLLETAPRLEFLCLSLALMCHATLSALGPVTSSRSYTAMSFEKIF